MPSAPTRAIRLAWAIRSRLAVAAIALLSGCTSPVVALKPLTSQQSAGNLRDWQAAADRLVRSMADQGIVPGPAHAAMPVRLLFPGPYYVNVMAQGSSFLEDMRGEIEQNLMRRGAAVARAPAGATVLNLDVDVVHWGTAYPYFDTEAVWRATIVSGDRVVMKSGELLYINSADIPLYRGTVTLAAIASPGTAMLGSARALRYAP